MWFRCAFKAHHNQRLNVGPIECLHVGACGLSVVQIGKFVAFVGNNVVETLSANALGMAVGSIAPTTEAALVLGPAAMLVFIVFGGVYTNPDDMAKWLKWLPHTSGIKCGYDALCKNELQGLALEQQGPRSFRNGDEVLVARGFSGSMASSLLQQVRIMLAHWWITYCILKAKKPKFQQMVSPPEASTTTAAEEQHT
jgi:hypothetical protein